MDAIHPGYGFLAENDDFAQVLHRRRHRFHRPQPRSHAHHGRQGFCAVGIYDSGRVPAVPGSSQGLRDDEIAAEAQRIGLPVLIKASAGGGGKGMAGCACRVWMVSAEPGAARREAMSVFPATTRSIWRS